MKRKGAEKKSDLEEGLLQIANQVHTLSDLI